MSEESSELVMPFVCCASSGGAYDDESFVAGWELGSIDAALKVMAPLGATVARWVKPEMVVAQLDLIAMKHGLRLTVGPLDESGTWQNVEIAAQAPGEDT